MEVLQKQKTDLTLESFLKQGTINLGKLREMLLTAAFIPYDQVQPKIYAQSARGTRHLLALLHANLMEMVDMEEARELIRAADNAYPYDMNISKAQPLDWMLLKGAVTLSLYKEDIRLYCRQTEIPTSERTPGLYSKVAYATTIEEVLQLALAMDFEWERKE